jgi:hypothetical protein
MEPVRSLIRLCRTRVDDATPLAANNGLLMRQPQSSKTSHLRRKPLTPATGKCGLAVLI